MFEGWYCHGIATWPGPESIDSETFNIRFAAEYEVLQSKKEQTALLQKDPRRTSLATVSEQGRREVLRQASQTSQQQRAKEVVFAPVGDHPLRAHPVRRRTNGSSSGSYHFAHL